MRSDPRSVGFCCVKTLTADAIGANEVSISFPIVVLPCIRDKLNLSLLKDMNGYTIRTPQQLGSVLQGYRKDRMLTQKDAGLRVGLPQKEVSKMELDPSNTAFARIFKLLAALDLELVVRPRDKSADHSEW